MQARSIFRDVTQGIALSAVLGSATLVAACGSNEKATTDTAQGAASAAPSTQGAAGTGAKVVDIRIGTKMDANKQVTRQTDIFTAKDTLYAAVHIVGAAPNTEVTGRWTFQDGKKVDEQKQSVTPPNDAWNGFHAAKSGGWPVGTYTFHVLLNGQEVQKRDVMVK